MTNRLTNSGKLQVQLLEFGWKTQPATSYSLFTMPLG